MTEHELPPAELDVMQCLWSKGELTAREVRELLAKRRPMSHSSVCTLLNRLTDKEFVDREKATSGKAFVYTSIVAPDNSRRRVIGDVLDRVFRGSGVDLVASLLETHPPNEDELQQLQSLLDELKAQKRTSAATKKRRKS